MIASVLAVSPRLPTKERQIARMAMVSATRFSNGSFASGISGESGMPGVCSGTPREIPLQRRREPRAFEQRGNVGIEPTDGLSSAKAPASIAGCDPRKTRALSKMLARKRGGADGAAMIIGVPKETKAQEN